MFCIKRSVLVTTITVLFVTLIAAKSASAQTAQEQMQQQMQQQLYQQQQQQYDQQQQQAQQQQQLQQQIMQQQQFLQQQQQQQNASAGMAGISPYCGMYGTCPATAPNYFNPGGILTNAYRSAGLCQLGDAACPASSPDEVAPATAPVVPHRIHHRRHKPLN